MSRPSERALWVAVVDTLTAQIEPAVTDPVGRRAVQRLTALARYARDRGPDRAPDVDAHVRAIIGDDDPVAVLLDATDERADRLRAVLRVELERALAEERVLLTGFGFVEEP